MRRRFPFLIVCVALTGCALLESATVSAPTGREDDPNNRPSPAKPPVSSSPPAAVHSSDPAFIAERVRHALATGRLDVAEGYLLQLIRLKPNDAAPWFQLGNLYAEQGRLEAAERAYRESLRRRDDAKTLHNLGLVQVRLGIGALREAQARLPPDAAARRETHEFLQTLLEAATP